MRAICWPSCQPAVENHRAFKVVNRRGSVVEKCARASIGELRAALADRAVEHHGFAVDFIESGVDAVRARVWIDPNRAFDPATLG